jgi:pimeloyl-ACP methyl ester carboxylesterase
MLMTTEVDRHRLLLFTLKGVAFDELGELALGHVRLRRPGALRQLPVFLMWGDKDPVFEFLERFQEIYPHARTLVIPGAHHFPFAEAPNEMIAAIRSWWADASSTTSQ